MTRTGDRRPAAARQRRARWWGARPGRLVVALLLLTGLAACGGGGGPAAEQAGARGGEGDVLRIGAIPDQDRDKLQAIYGGTAAYLSRELGIRAEYVPVTDYAGAVGQFRTGDLDLVWFGGLTGVPAAAQVPGSTPLVQRDVDAQFHSIVIANTGSGPGPIADEAGLTALRGTRWTYGSESSTSGYLMPAYFLLRAGVDPEKGFSGQPGFSGSHDKTIQLVESGSFQAGAVNEQVWSSRLAGGSVDTAKARAVWRTPAYHDYHWLLGPQAGQRLGDDLADRLRRYLTGLPPGDGVLELFGAGSFVTTEATNYDQIEEIGRQLGLVS